MNPISLSRQLKWNLPIIHGLTGKLDFQIGMDRSGGECRGGQPRANGNQWVFCARGPPGAREGRDCCRPNQTPFALRVQRAERIPQSAQKPRKPQQFLFGIFPDSGEQLSSRRQA